MKLNVNLAALMISKLCRVWIPNWGWILLILLRWRSNLCTCMAKGPFCIRVEILQGLHSWVWVLEVNREKQPLTFRGVQCPVHWVFITRKEVNTGDFQCHWIILSWVIFMQTIGAWWRRATSTVPVCPTCSSLSEQWSAQGCQRPLRPSNLTNP